MQCPAFDVHGAFSGLPVVTLDQFSAAAYKLGQYIMRVTNAEGSSGFGAAVMRDYPVMEQAVGVLGHAVVRQACPDAPLPMRDDASPDARLAAMTYASIGTRLMACVPEISHRLGPYAAGCVVAALYGHGSPPSPQARAVVTKAFDLLDQVILVSGAGDAAVAMCDARFTSAEPSAPVLRADQDGEAFGDGEHGAH